MLTITLQLQMIGRLFSQKSPSPLVYAYCQIKSYSRTKADFSTDNTERHRESC